MKKRKLITYTLVGAMTLGMGISCSDSFLDQQPPGLYPEASVNTKSGIEGMLINAYAGLHGQAGTWYVTPINWVWGSVGSDDAYKGSELNDQSDVNFVQRYSILPSNPILRNKWDAIYDGIDRANQVLRKLADPELAALFTADEIKNLTGQARFLRGFHHFEGAKVFKKVVYIDEKVTDYVIPNSTPIWDKIEADLKFAYDNLPEKQNEVGRANKWAAASFLAKVYMFEGKSKYADAGTLLKNIIDNGMTSTGLRYGLVDLFNDNFNVKTENNKESVFSMQFSMNDGSTTNGNYEMALAYPHNSGSPGAGCCGFYQPSQNLVNSFATVDGLPDFDHFNDKAQLTDEAIISTANWDGTKAYKVKDSVYVTRVDALKPNADRVYKALTDNTNKDPLTSASDWKLVWQENTSIELDPRIDWTVGRRGIPYLDWGVHPGRNWVRKVDYGGPYSPKKHVYSKADKDAGLGGSVGWGYNSSAENFTLLRVADLYLWYAEVLADAGQLDNATGAAYYVNLVRARAANTNGYVKDADGSDAANYVIDLYPSFPDQTYAVKAIQWERRLEFAMEGHRFFDLVRWGVAEQTINNYLTAEAKLRVEALGGATFRPRNVYYPIPEYAINQSYLNGQPTLEQNDNY